MTDLRQRAHIPRGAVTRDETFVPLDAPIPEKMWTTAQPPVENTGVEEEREPLPREG